MPNNLFVVDTSAWILALRKDFLPVAKDRIGILLQENSIVTTGMIKLELLGGTRTEKEYQRLKSRLDALDLVETDNALWEQAYGLAFKLRRKGLTVPYTDILIASSALRIKATIVHADLHFDLIRKHIGLEVESFVKRATKSSSK